MVEHAAVNRVVVGSSPTSGANFANKNEGFGICSTDSAQNPPGPVNVRFPKVIRFRRVEATIYGKRPAYPFYRLAYYVAGKRVVRSFKSYGEAKSAAEKIVRDVAEGSQVAALTGEQSRDALAALQRLESHRQITGRRFSLLVAVSKLLEADTKLDGRSLDDAIEGFLQTVATVRRKDLAEAVEEFIESRKHKAESKDGKRSQLSPAYAKHVSAWLREFAGAFPATAVSDLSKEHLNLYVKSHAELSAKTRNDRRATVKMFLTWAAKRDYLPVNHRLLEADGMMRETTDTGETDFYRPGELQKFLENAPADLMPVIALGGLAGLRVEEIMRLDWADVWRVEGHIEITAKQAKTRQRRLVEICPALAALLENHKKATGRIWQKNPNLFFVEFSDFRENLKIPSRRNGLRHGFCTYHFALHANENLTAQQAGNSPAIIHGHYKGLATKADAEKWFSVKVSGKSADKIK
jgi:integrase